MCPECTVPDFHLLLLLTAWTQAGSTTPKSNPPLTSRGPDRATHAAASEVGLLSVQGSGSSTRFPLTPAKGAAGKKDMGQSMLVCGMSWSLHNLAAMCWTLSSGIVLAEGTGFVTDLIDHISFDDDLKR